MSAIAWWVVPIVATLAAIAYVTWRGRPRPPEDTHEAMEARERFRRAIENPAPGQTRPGTGGSGSGSNVKGDDGGERPDA